MHKKIQEDSNQTQANAQAKPVQKKQKAPEKKTEQTHGSSSSIAQGGAPAANDEAGGYVPPTTRQGQLGAVETKQGKKPVYQAKQRPVVREQPVPPEAKYQNVQLKQKQPLLKGNHQPQQIDSIIPTPKTSAQETPAGNTLGTEQRGERLPAEGLRQVNNLLDNDDTLNISETVGKNAVNKPNDVKVIQRLLKRKFTHIKVTGICDSATIKAIEEFQKSTFGGWSDGKIEPNRSTWNKLILLQHFQRHNNKPLVNAILLNAVGRGQPNTSTDVTIVQKLLNHHGASLTVNGTCDKATIKAIEVFQMQHFTFRDGVISVRGQTWKKLSEELIGVKKANQKTKVSPYKDSKLTGAPILYIFLEDYDKKDYDYDKINKDSGAWDYVMDKNFHSIITKLKTKYGNKQGFITDMVIRSHGYCAFGTQHGPVISGSVLSNLRNLWDTRVKDMMYLRSLLTGKAKVLFTACSIVQTEGSAQNNVIKDFGEFFLKGTDRSLFLNRTKSSSRGYIDQNKNGMHDIGKEKEYINFDTNLIKPDKKSDGTYKKLWAGYLWLKYNQKNNSITWKDNYYNVELDTETSFFNRLGSGPSEGIAPEEISNLPVNIKSKKNHYGLD